MRIARAPRSASTATLDELFTDFRERARRTPRPVRAVGSVVRFGRMVVVWTVMGAITGLLLGLTVPTFFGYHNLVVMSGSMEPAIHTGDLVIVKEIAPTDAHVGDVVTFRDPESKRLISHRVRKITVADGIVHVETKGDASNAVQTWQIPMGGRIGRVDFHLYKLGYAMFWVTRPWGRMLLVVVPAVLLGLWEIVRIWRPSRRRARG